MTFSKAQLKSLSQSVKAGVLKSTGTIDAVNTSEDINLGMVASKITVQSEATLSGSYEVSIDGVNFINGGSLSPSINSFSSHNVVVVRVIWSSGSGKAVIGAVP